MDLKLHRPQAACARTGRAFVAHERFHSALVRAAGGLERIDVCDEAWQGPPPEAIACWQSTFPAAHQAGPSLAPPDVLLDALEGLEENRDEEPLRYLLALQLVRRRVLRIVNDAGAGGDELLLACRKRDREYRVRSLSPGEASAAGVEEKLAALLWSGDAA
ncbi:MAG: hypothetical protein DWI03_06180 [Planctomycetota bacterium]|jgi:hypothetical protein|nr:MAG: hypothetical protein DWI03_06180 [Planctomycetota bacterium]